jgi:hypothetical protein
VPNLFAAQGFVLTILSLAAFALEVFAVVDASRHRADAYTAAGKLTKNKWLLILGIGAAVGFVFVMSNPLGFLSINAVVAAIVYLADVRPALQQVSGRGGRGAGGGPYGGW